MWKNHNDRECRCGGMCRWWGRTSSSKEEKIAHLEKKEARLQKMIVQIQRIKEALGSESMNKNTN